MRDICYCIPAIDNPDSIEQTITDCLDKNPGALIVVDDGFPVPLEDRLFSHQIRRSIQGGQLKILRQERNLGVERALEVGSKEARYLGFKKIITPDGIKL